LGDVVEESDGDLMGDGVNIAARLEGIAKPDTTCLAASRVPPSPQTIKIKGRALEASAFAGPTNGVEIPPLGPALKPISAARRAPGRPACHALGDFAEMTPTRMRPSLTCNRSANRCQQPDRE
jgi:hypothetical protein